MFSFIGWIIFGLVAGVFAKALMPGKDPGGLIVTTLLGIAGAVIGGFIGQALFGYGRLAASANDFTRPGFLMSLLLSIVGALILLGLYRVVATRRYS